MTSSTFFLIIVLLSLLAVAGFLIDAQAEHIRQHGEYVIHPRVHYYDNVFEIHIIEVFIQSKSPPECASHMALNDKGECTDIDFHYDVYPLYLVQKLPSYCSEDAIGCTYPDRGIYILNGKQNNIPSFGGCNVLWHEIMHLRLGFEDETLDHQWMAKNLPNSRCATPQT